MAARSGDLLMLNTPDSAVLAVLAGLFVPN
jgi:hypothetical protein